MDAQWDNLWDQYLPYGREICEPLTEKFGTKFYLQHTGGGCMAIATTLENGDEILVTDAQDVLSPWYIRQRRWDHDREILGFAVGYYTNDENRCGAAIAFVIFRKARDAQAVTIAVTTAINQAARVKAGVIKPSETIEL